MQGVEMFHEKYKRGNKVNTRQLKSFRHCVFISNILEIDNHFVFSLLINFFSIRKIVIHRKKQSHGTNPVFPLLINFSLVL